MKYIYLVFILLISFTFCYKHHHRFVRQDDEKDEKGETEDNISLNSDQAFEYRVKYMGLIYVNNLSTTHKEGETKDYFNGKYIPFPKLCKRMEKGDFLALTTKSAAHQQCWWEALNIQDPDTDDYESYNESKEKCKQFRGMEYIPNNYVYSNYIPYLRPWQFQMFAECFYGIEDQESAPVTLEKEYFFDLFTQQQQCRHEISWFEFFLHLCADSIEGKVLVGDDFMPYLSTYRDAVKQYNNEIEEYGPIRPDEDEVEEAQEEEKKKKRKQYYKLNMINKSKHIHRFSRK